MQYKKNLCNIGCWFLVLSSYKALKLRNNTKDHRGIDLQAPRH